MEWKVLVLSNLKTYMGSLDTGTFDNVFLKVSAILREPVVRVLQRSLFLA